MCFFTVCFYCVFFTVCFLLYEYVFTVCFYCVFLLCVFLFFSPAVNGVQQTSVKPRELAGGVNE